MQGLSLVAASGGRSSSRCAGLSLSRPLLLRSTGSRRAGSVIVAYGPSCSMACGIFPTRARTRVPCIGRQILNHCVTREAQESIFVFAFWQLDCSVSWCGCLWFSCLKFPEILGFVDSYFSSNLESFHPLFHFFYTSLLEYNCFTMLWYFLLYNKVNQLYVYIYPHIPSLLSLPPTLPIPPL